MGDLSESVWHRGQSDATKWLGSLWLRFALIVVTAGAGVAANRAGMTGGAVALITAATAALFLASVLLAAIINAPIRQRDEARNELRAVHATKDGRRTDLADWLRKGRKLYGQQPADVKQWRRIMKSWIFETSQFLEFNYGKAESEMFLSPPHPDDVDLPYSVSHDHNWYRLVLKAHMQIIEGILVRNPQ